MTDKIRIAVGDKVEVLDKRGELCGRGIYKGARHYKNGHLFHVIVSNDEKISYESWFGVTDFFLHPTSPEEVSIW